ncbi:hypothetical protein TWF718_000326 [Orbilia javanica]|uniref:Uncharacterized protein n=1 Tax=Orbilia javanica TaxID=47235 RepID=A0AAN8RFS7_9PEZI
MRFKTPNIPLIYFYLFTTITGVYSQSLNCTAELQTVNSQSDLDALSNCVTLSGSINFGRDIVNATIRGIQTIRGALRIPYGANVQRLEAPNLSFVGGIMQVTGALNLTVLSMPSLANVGSLRLEYLPRLRSVEFSSQINSLGDDTAIQLVVWSTAIESLADIIYRKVESVQIIDNPNLFDINLPIGNITGVFVVRDNGENTTVTLPYLESAGFVHMGDLVGEVSLPNLTSVETDVRITSRYLRSIELPNLVNIGKERVVTNTLKATLEVNRSPNLTAVSFPKLQWIATDLRINGSEGWTNLNGFPVLETVGKDIVIDGSFLDVDLPKLRAGSQESTFWINSPQVGCAGLLEQSIFTEGDWKTNITCNGNTFDLSPEETPTEDKSLSGEAIGGIAVGVVAAVVVAFVILFVYLRRKGYMQTLPWRRADIPKIPELEDGEGGIQKGKLVEADAANSRATAELEDPKSRLAPELEGSSVPLAELEGTLGRAPEHSSPGVESPELERK